MAAKEGLHYNERSGFLVGEVIADEIDRLADELQALRGIEANTAMAVKLLQAMAKAPAPDDIGRVSALPRAQAAANDPQPTPERRQPSPRAPVGTQRKSTAPADPRQPDTVKVEAATLQARRARDTTPATPGVNRPMGERPGQAPAQARRDAGGRFSTAPGGGRRPDEPNDPGRGGTLSAIRSIATAVKEATAGASEGSENIDPTIQAAKEVGSILSPAKALLRPLGGLFGRSKEAKEAKQHREQITWLRRIWRGQADAGKGGASGGMLRLLGMLMPMLGMLLAPLKALGRLTGMAKLAGGAAGLARAILPRGRRAGGEGGNFWRRRSSAEPGGARSLSARSQPSVDAPGRSERMRSAGAGSKGRIGRTLSAAGGMLKGGAGALVKKLPFIGAMVGGGMLASSLMKDAKTPEERRDKFAGVGSTAGSLAGGALGLIGGPIGMMAGSYIGEIVGEKVGTWLADADLGAMVNNITGLFNDMADTAGAMASKTWDFVSGAWSGMIDRGVKLFTGMQTWFSDKLAWIGDELTQIKDSVKDKVQDVAYTVRDKVSSGASSVADAGRNVLNRITGGSYTGGSNAAKSTMISAMAEAGITDPKSQAALMANVDHETGGFKRFDENLNYSAERLQKVFPKYYSNAADARADAGNAEAIANRVYGGRMGNTDPGDGFKFRGRGMIQLTGRNQYEAMSKKVGLDLVNNPDLAADPKVAAKIAAEYWKSSGADQAARAGDFTGARKKVNGGTNGLEDTLAKTEAYLQMAKAGELTAPQSADKSKVKAPEGAQKAMSGTIAAVKAGQAHPQTQPIGVLAPAKAPGATPSAIAAPTSLAAAQQAFAKAAPEVPQALKGASFMPLAAAAAPAVPASPVAAPKVTAAPTAPAAPTSVKSISYQAPAPDANLAKIPTIPEVRTPPSASPSSGPATTQPLAPLAQGLSDRQIAHITAGGIGMGMAQL